MAIQKTQAIVLNNRDFRESSLLTTFYTKDFGKLKGLVKGIKGPKLRYGSRLEPFSFNNLVFYENRKSNFCIIAQCDRVYGFNKFQGDLERTTYASYLAELIDAVTSPGDANVALFELLSNSLELLSGEDDIERIIRIFEIRLLNLSGFMPRLDCCVCCGRKIFIPHPKACAWQGRQRNKKSPTLKGTGTLKHVPTPKRGTGGRVGTSTRFSHSLGGLICESCTLKGTSSDKDKRAKSISLGTIASLEHIESTEWQRVLRFKMTSRVRDELEKILRTFLSLHLERKFKSLDFLEKIRNFTIPTGHSV